jgi:hypothetical protein
MIMFNLLKNMNNYMVVVLLLSMLFLSDCEEETPTAQVITESKKQPVQSAPESSPMKRRDVPPSGVDAQLDTMRVASSVVSCNETIYKEPTLTLRYCREIVSECTICFYGFDPNQVIELDIYGPEGPVEEKKQVTPNISGTANWSRVIDPIFFEIGEYVVHASQANTLLATEIFTIQEPATPKILVNPKYRSPGQSFRILMAGFQPGEQVPLHVYHDDTGIGRVYFSTLTPAQIDERGRNLMYVFDTHPNNPLGWYYVVTPYTDFSFTPPSLYNASFKLEE